uniref:DExH-box helicase 57 n=1 Tax=Rousettus aegyptiacus TaxID=9407 RepID=A0A7J8FFC7_ROUAE|nr:DExH-box helicase 57 [Rousettus aegyptiacus]
MQMPDLKEAFLRKRKMMSLIVMMLSTGQLDKKLPLFLTLILWNVLDQALWSLIIQNLQSQHLQCKNFPGMVSTPNAVKQP